MPSLYFLLVGFVFLIGLIVIGISSKRAMLMHLLIFSMLISPRVPFGNLSAHQRIDFRIDDLIIGAMLISSAIMLVTRKIHFKYPKYMLFLAIYISWTLFSFYAACIIHYFDPFYSFFFFLRNIEYSSLAFIIPFFIKQPKSIVTLFRYITIGVGLNLAWMLFQFVTNNKGPLLSIVNIPSYGYTLLSTTQPSAVGAVFTFAFIVYACYFFIMKKNVISFIFISCAVCGNIFTLSRSTIVSMCISVLLIVTLTICLSSRKLQISDFFFPLIFIGFGTLLSYLVLTNSINIDMPVFRLESQSFKTALEEVRLKGIWLPILKAFFKSPVFGYGVGNIRQLHVPFDEAHNYYLRLLVETGIVGFNAFSIFVLLFIKKLLLLLKLPLTREHRCICFIAITWTVTVAVISLGQDSLQCTEMAILSFLTVGIVNYIFHYKYNETKSDVASVNTKNIENYKYKTEDFIESTNLGIGKLRAISSE